MKRMLSVCVVSMVTFAGAAGCDDGRPTGSSAGSQAAAATVNLPGDLLTATPPQGAKTVAEVRRSATANERVVVSGVVAGLKEPIAGNRAIFTLLDASIETCDRNPEDECATPWDACCEPKDEIAANAVTVQVVDAEGKPLKTTLAGAGGLKPLSKVTVVGTFVPSADGKSAIVNATSLHVQP